MENDNVEQKAKYYNEHIKKCIYTYREKNRDIINARRRELHKLKMQDPEYAAKRKEKLKKYYKPKQQQSDDDETTEE
jgi:hypothetical protein